MGSTCNTKADLAEELVLDSAVLSESCRSSFTICSISSLETQQGEPQETTRKLPTKSKFYKQKLSSAQETPIVRRKLLDLSVLDSQVLRQGTTIKITPDEINGNPHDLEESFVFGKDSSSHYSFPNDEKMGDQQFKIKYNPCKNEYFIKDSNTGTGLFTQLVGRQIVDRNVICFGNTQFFVSCDEDQILKIQCFKGEYEGRCTEVFPHENTFFKLGRSRNCDIIINETNTSRYQCTFIYENGTWFVYDGKPGGPSTNGVWILANKSVQIKNGLIFKTGLSTFTARVY